MGLSFKWAGQSYAFAYGTISDIADLMEQVGLPEYAKEYEKILGAVYLDKDIVKPSEVAALNKILKSALIRIEEEQKVKGLLMSHNERVTYEKSLKDFAEGRWHSKEKPRPEHFASTPSSIRKMIEICEDALNKNVPIELG
ncbi:MAG: hypothetical protein QXQ87_09035 [Halobacteria archaeon]